MKTIGISLMVAIAFAAGAFAQNDSNVHTIAGGGHWHIQFKLLTAATISGSFESRDARDDLTVTATAVASSRLRIPNTVQNNIQVLILDEVNYSRFTGGQSFVAAYDSGRVIGGQIKANLAANSYHLVLSNRHSLLAAKSVRLELDAASRKLIFDPPTEQYDSRSVPLIDDAIVVPAGSQGYTYYVRTINQPVRVVGKFMTTGGNNDIDFLIFDAVGFRRWQAGLYSAVYLQTGYVSGEQSIDIRLQPNTYVFVFDNRKSVITRKNVTSWISISPIAN